MAKLRLKEVVAKNYRAFIVGGLFLALVIILIVFLATRGTDVAKEGDENKEGVVTSNIEVPKDKYEEDAYLDLSKRLPHPGDETTTEDGYHAVVDSVNILKQRIRVIVDVSDDEREAREYGPDDLKFIKKRKKVNNEEQVSEEEMKALKELEKE